HYTKEELVGKKIVVVSNLKPAKLRGKESQGMLLAADDGNNVKLLEPKQSEPGDEVVVDGETQGKEEITIDEFFNVEITTKDSKAVYMGKPLKTEKEEISVDIADGSKVR
ncbi:MAG: methionine--tRNA ligase, partial [Nanoarchaeota archaeon]